MKKIKLLLAAALLLCTAGAWAQSDVTSTYLTADFTSSTGWTNYSGGGSEHSEGFGLIGTLSLNSKASTTDATHLSTEYCCGFSARWNGRYTYNQQTSAELPEGYYELTYDVQDVNSTSTKYSMDNHFYVQVGETKYVDSATEWMNAGASGWTTHTISFGLAAASSITLSMGYGNKENKGSNDCPAIYVSHLKLRQYSDKDTYLRIKNGLTEATYAAPVVTDFVVNGTFTDNVNGWTATGGFQNSTRASNQSGAFTVPFWENWNPSAKVNKMYQTIANIPNGTYRLDIAAFVSVLAENNATDAHSQYVFANEDKTYLTTGDPTAYEVYTVVTTNQIEIGLEQTTATAEWMGIDNVSLRYYGAGDVINDAKNASHKLAWEEAKAAAEDAYADAAYTNVTGSEKTALATEIAKAEPSTADDYDTATANLISATSAFTAAKPAYDAYAEISGVATALSVDTGDAPTTAAGASAATNTLNVAVYNATTETNVFNVTAVYAPSWSDMSTASGQHWSGGGNSYPDEWRGDTNSSSRNATVTLPDGDYILMSAGRGSTNTVVTMSANGTTITFASKGDEGRGIDLTGAANFADVADTYANDNKGRGWEWRYIPVTLATETAVTITQTITRLSGGAWGSFSDFKILKVGVVATSDDYDDLNDAIADAEAKILGFEDGEYAPYVNATALAKLAAAKAIDQDADNDQDVVQDLTTYLNTDANWTANSGEVNAVNTALFTTGDVTGSGWTQTQGWGQYKENVYSTSSGTFTYGELNGYTMPLKANTVYKLTFNHRAWDGSNSENGGTVSVLCSGDGLDATSFTGQGTNTTPKEETFYFRTGDAGNYVFTLNAPSGRPTFGGVTIVKAVVEDLTINEKADYTAVKNYANVTLDRTIKADVWNTFVVPFDISNSELKSAFGNGVAVAEFSDGGASEDDVTVSFTKMGTPAISANTPVLLKGSAGTSFTFDDKIIETGDAKVDGTYLDFVGTYDASTNIAAGDYFISANKLYKSSGATTISGTRAYLHAKSAGVKAMLFIDDEATSIDAINGVEAENGVIYNIAGQRLNKAQKGINIVNGKKVLK